MKIKLKTKLALLLLLLCCGVVHSHSNEKDYLSAIEKALSEKDCKQAEKVYGWYKEDTKKTNADIEHRIDECKKSSVPQPVAISSSPPSGNSSSSHHFTTSVHGYTFTMIAVEGGTFTMGCTNEQGDDCKGDEKPVHQVTLSSYYIGKFEVTQKLWREVMGSNPPDLKFKGCDECPVEYVSWNDIMGTDGSPQAKQLGYGGSDGFLYKLYKLTNRKFRLPTEAEWEYAARGGSGSHGTKYSGSNSLDAVAWYMNNSNSKTHPAGQKAANELGICDMNGNVGEWCNDWYGRYSSASQTNPQGPSTGSFHVLRGGSWRIGASSCRVAIRYGMSTGFHGSFLGLRLAASAL